jgi:SAM-dependent methyltransferase
VDPARLTPANFVKRSAEQILEDVNYAIQITNSHLGHLSAIGLSPAGLRVLELGPGVNLAPQLVIASMGGRMAVADRFLAPWDKDYHPAFYQAFRQRWAGPATAIDRVLRDGAYPDDVISCIASPAEDLATISTESIDLVLSNAVLEHVYSIPLVCREMARITAPGGVNLHQIDLRDHRDFERPLEFLTMPDDQFQREFDARHGECGNRLRQSEIRSAFEQAGFDVISVDANMQPDPSYLKELLPRLRSSRSRYRLWATDDLMVISALLKMRKRNIPNWRQKSSSAA